MTRRITLCFLDAFIPEDLTFVTLCVQRPPFLELSDGFVCRQLPYSSNLESAGTHADRENRKAGVKGRYKYKVPPLSPARLS